MEWLLALAIVWGSLEDASDNYKQQLAAAAAIMQEETDMYADPERAHAALQAEWTVLPEEAEQGDAIMVRAAGSSEGAAPSIDWNGKSYELLPFGTGYYVLLPVDAGMKPGTYQIGTASVTIKRKSFKTQYLVVTEEQEAMRRNTTRIEQDQKKVNEARRDSEPNFLFRDRFVRPAEGRLSTPYGFTRYINGKYSGSHRAIDIAAPEGTPVLATAAGKVVLAEELYLTGNSIYLDHGMSLFSQYAHLSEIKVKHGEQVEAGQVIGLIGSTGFSTGPHLHFTFWLHGIQANPDIFIESSPFQWQ